MTGITSWSAGQVRGAELSSVLRYRTRQLVAGVDLAEVNGDLVHAAELSYQGVGGWSVREPLTEDMRRDEDGNVLWSAQVRTGSPVNVPWMTG